MPDRRRTNRSRLPAALAALACAGCGSGEAGAPTPTPATELTIEVSASESAPDRTYRLRCGPPRGTHPDAASACAHLEAAGAEAFAPMPADVACTEIYGGPQVAHVEGTVSGTRVSADLARTNGCEIDRWDRLLPVVPLPRVPSA